MTPVAYALAGLIYVAETGWNYRKLKKGLITKEEFKRRAMYGAIGKVSALIGTSIGAAAGFCLGTVVLPGVGSIIGTVIGGVAGSLSIRALTIRMIEKVEDRIVTRKHRNQERRERFPRIRKFCQNMVKQKAEA